MRNVGGCLTAFVVLQIICGTACSRSERSRELSAMDNAYHSGILTKNEYEAKKAALESEATVLASLDKALESGILTKDEYQARKARVDAQAGNLAALEKALGAGILTKDEYRTKKAALLAPDAQVGPLPKAETAHRPVATEALHNGLLTRNAIQPGPAQDGLKTIDNPGGGQLIYGLVTGQSSLTGAMATMLRSMQRRFGERPQIGKFFRARNSDSVATFFTLTAKNQGGKRIAGMVIVSMLGSNQPGGAAIYDDAERFGRTMSGMLKKLDVVWQADSPKPTESLPSTRTSAPASAPQPLHRTPFIDGTGSIGLPAGWRLIASGAGTVRASGPNGEYVALASIWQMYDPTNQTGQNLIKFVTTGGRPFPASSAIYPYRGDLLGAWVATAQQVAQRAHLPIPTFQLTRSRKLPDNPGETDSVLVNGELDNHDGKGPLFSKIQMSKLRSNTPAPGVWTMLVTRLSAPTRLADEEWPTLDAIAASLNQNQAALDRQTADKVREFNEKGKIAIQKGEEARAAQDAKSRAFYKSRDDQNKASQSFQNYQLGKTGVPDDPDGESNFSLAFQHYQLDQTIVQDNETGERRTFANPSADFLVKADPNRYEYVPDFVVGDGNR